MNDRRRFIQGLAFMPLLGLGAIIRRPMPELPQVKNGDVMNAAFFNAMIDRLNELSKSK